MGRVALQRAGSKWWSIVLSGLAVSMARLTAAVSRRPR